VGHRAGLEGCGKKKSLAPTGVGTPDSSAYSESPYRLRCPGQVEYKLCTEKNFWARAEAIQIKINCILIHKLNKATIIDFV